MNDLKHWTVAEIVNAFPETLRVFRSYRIDICCGGRHTPEEVARKHGLDLERLLEDLEKVASAPK